MNGSHIYPWFSIIQITDSHVLSHGSQSYFWPPQKKDHASFKNLRACEIIFFYEASGSLPCILWRLPILWGWFIKPEREVLLIGKFFSPKNWIGNSLISIFSKNQHQKVIKKIQITAQHWYVAWLEFFICLHTHNPLFLFWACFVSFFFNFLHCPSTLFFPLENKF